MQYFSFIAIVAALAGSQLVGATCPFNTCYQQQATACEGLPLAAVNTCLEAASNACTKECN
ncbi:uncharacterized protein N7459_002616 [Penicillium hispanicum]|uniref:uncharacterized protein n=1 Tax=Penicillium hispanicum TaxID=1080232 RepID=UPI002541A812|nr:uncharacterized protein N7459_002616 [Penicillium hispanicum]KAJ5586851.1 hypothetical protein N7459_002616 [Penicillium hispanicum]